MHESSKKISLRQFPHDRLTIQYDSATIFPFYQTLGQTLSLIPHDTIPILFQLRILPHNQYDTVQPVRSQRGSEFSEYVSAYKVPTEGVALSTIFAIIRELFIKRKAFYNHQQTSETLHRSAISSSRLRKENQQAGMWSFNANLGFQPPYGGHGGGGNTAIHQSSQACPSCRGCGFRHDSSMPHTKPRGEKCMFCMACIGCGGRGIVSGSTMSSNNNGGYPGNTVIQQGVQACPSCHGCGFRHNSSVTHTKHKGEKCMFCETCTGCDGRGIVQGDTVVHSGNNNGSYPGNTMIQQGVHACPSCHGRGFRHNASMTHHKPQGEKCMFCETCGGCGGRGVVQ